MRVEKKPKILVTGSGGQLGSSFKRIAGNYPDLEFVFPTRYDFDITVQSRETIGLIKQGIDAVINCAAYTNVEKAELEQEEATLVNSTAVGYLAEACHNAGCLLIHFSTDYVFDGSKNSPYNESDITRPLSVYGQSKLAGEMVLQETMKRHLIIRTSWLYSEYGHNFLKTMLRLASENGELNVVNDQVASPTYAGHLATHIAELIQKIIVKTEHFDYGLYHYSENGEASWWQFAKEIIKISGMNVPVNEISSASMMTRAQRPAYSKLDNANFIKSSGAIISTWQEGLKECYKNLRKLKKDGRQ